jgi:hypothetical protein
MMLSIASFIMHGKSGGPRHGGQRLLPGGWVISGDTGIAKPLRESASCNAGYPARITANPDLIPRPSWKVAFPLSCRVMTGLRKSGSYRKRRFAGSSDQGVFWPADYSHIANVISTQKSWLLILLRSSQGPRVLGK